jgi:hypothetical protein
MTGLNLIAKENTQVVRQGLQKLSGKIPQVGRLGIYQTAQRIKTRLGKPGLSISYPVKWDSDKQRKAFFATDGFGGGIPHKRGDMNRQWKIVDIGNGYQITNDAPGALFVYGDMFGASQSLIHRNRWPLFKDVVNDEIKNLPKNLSKQLRTAAIAEGFAVGL